MVQWRIIKRDLFDQPFQSCDKRRSRKVCDRRVRVVCTSCPEFVSWVNVDNVKNTAPKSILGRDRDLNASLIAPRPRRCTFESQINRRLQLRKQICFMTFNYSDILIGSALKFQIFHFAASKVERWLLTWVYGIIIYGFIYSPCHSQRSHLWFPKKLLMPFLFFLYLVIPP